MTGRVPFYGLALVTLALAAANLALADRFVPPHVAEQMAAIADLRERIEDLRQQTSRDLCAQRSTECAPFRELRPDYIPLTLWQRTQERGRCWTRGCVARQARLLRHRLAWLRGLAEATYDLAAPPGRQPDTADAPTITAWAAIWNDALDALEADVAARPAAVFHDYGRDTALM